MDEPLSVGQYLDRLLRDPDYGSLLTASILDRPSLTDKVNCPFIKCLREALPDQRKRPISERDYTVSRYSEYHPLLHWSRIFETVSYHDDWTIAFYLVQSDDGQLLQLCWNEQGQLVGVERRVAEQIVFTYCLQERADDSMRTSDVQQPGYVLSIINRGKSVELLIPGTLSKTVSREGRPVQLRPGSSLYHPAKRPLRRSR